MTILIDLVVGKSELEIKEEIEFLKSNKEDGFYFKNEEIVNLLFKSKNLIIELSSHYMTGEEYNSYDLDEYIEDLEETLKEWEEQN